MVFWDTNLIVYFLWHESIVPPPPRLDAGFLILSEVGCGVSDSLGAILSALGCRVCDSTDISLSNFFNMFKMGKSNHSEMVSSMCARFGSCYVLDRGVSWVLQVF